jgi:arginase
VAAKVVRQPKKIVLLGVPTSAAASAPGREGAPQALRSAGLVGRLQSAGYEVTDLGDDPPQIFQADEQSPRARNLVRVIAMLEALKPRVEIATKSGALPLILSGDGSAALATVAGVRRYFRPVGIVLMDRDAGLHTPATTTTGSVDGMLVSHLSGRGAAELVRFWPEPPLVREPDLAIFGVERIDPGEDEALRRSTVRQYLASDVKRIGARAAAKSAVERIHANGHDYVLHIDVDVIADFQATDSPGSEGLGFEDVRAAAEVFAAQKHLAAIEVTGYDPTKDSDGSGVKLLVELIAGVLEKRLEALTEAAEKVALAVVPAPVIEQKEPGAEQTSAEEPEAKIESHEEVSPPPVVAGEAWSSGPGEETETLIATDADDSGDETHGTSEDTDQSHS